VTAFKLDENLPIEAATMFRAAGHDAATVMDQHLGGKGDADIAAVCRSERRVLVTLDLDFANVQVYPPPDHAGIVVLRLGRQDKPHVLDLLTMLVPHLAQADLNRRLWIVEETRIRMRE
jgi:predicted nuclease of predicted toxin-antitoxin system